MRPRDGALPVKASWTIRIDRLQIRLAVGVHSDEIEPQPVWVSLRASGAAAASPETLAQCIDYEPLCRWLTEVWPSTPHVPLIETRINELFELVFGLDGRVQEAWVGLYKHRMSQRAAAVGIERGTTRSAFELQAASDLATHRCEG